MAEEMMGAKGPSKGMKIEVEIEKGPMMPEEEAMLGKARELDDVEEEGYMAVAPQGEFSVGGLNALVDALNSVLPMFEMEDYPRFSEAVEVFPSEFVKQLTMVMEAAKAAGLDDMVIDFASIVDDKSAKMAAGKIRALAGNTGFKRFLRSERPAEAPAAPAPGGMPAAPMAMQAEEMGMGEDELMMSRLG